MSDSSFKGNCGTALIGSIWYDNSVFPWFAEKIDKYMIETPEYSEVDLEDYLTTGLIKEGERERKI